VECLVNARVIRDVDVEPTALEIRADAGLTYSLVLTDRRPQPLTVQSVRPSSEQLTAEIAEAQPGRVRLAVTVSPDGVEGEAEEAITIRTDDPLHAEIVVPVRVVRPAPVRVSATPAEIYFRPERGESTLSHLAQLRGQDEEEIEITDCTASHPALSVTWPKGPRSATAVRVRLTLGADAAEGNAEVRVRLAKPVGEIVVIPVVWRAPKGD
jgi:hypothetical protein